MRFIGVTGGVGAGKSKILDFLAEEYGAYILRADELAAELMSPGHRCYDSLCSEFFDILQGMINEDGSFIRPVLAERIMADDDKRLRLNAIVHPEVKQAIIEDSEKKRALGTGVYVLEAALLIEEHYDKIVDELWYIYASRETRRERLRLTRGYSDERIASLFAAQLSEEEYRAHCDYVIDNDGEIEKAFGQIRMLMSKADNEQEE
ncbi:MAG: dephospho-CoA kinase [Lachnospiraceae bacterium]|nr:dephospho-CoA kinase [Lachnospiraceae bacterium]